MAARVIVLCLDAFDDALSDELIAEGRLRGLAKLKRESARYKLDHAKARYTGLTWEHFCSGRRPESVDKWSVMSFDPKTLGVRQSFATERPFLTGVDVKCVVFDVPYFDLQAMPNGAGFVGWSGHDLGVRPFSRPGNLIDEIDHQFGPPLEGSFLSTLVYPSAERTRDLGAALRHSVMKRSAIAEWLLAKRLPDWDVALIGFGESHDAIELFYHGVDPHHHLAGLDSAAAAREALIAVYEEISDQIERLMARFPDATFVAFTMHGMGQNDTDIPTMILLPELLYRMRFQQPLFQSRLDWQSAFPPVLLDGEDWNAAILGAMNSSDSTSSRPSRAYAQARRSAIGALKRVLGPSLSRRISAMRPADQKQFIDVDWMPAMQYARYWPFMDAFALPGYFDGRIRVNLSGRERHGRVPLARYSATLDRVEEVLRASVDIATGEPIVREISRPARNDPMGLPDTQGDLAVMWNESPIGFRHALYGDIGPGPMRRSGGHSGEFGALYVRAKNLSAGDYGLRSSFDVAPTILDLLGKARSAAIDGQTVLGDGKSAARIGKAAG